MDHLVLVLDHARQPRVRTGETALENSAGSRHEVKQEPGQFWATTEPASPVRALAA